MCSKCNPYPDIMNAIASEASIIFNDDGTAYITRTIVTNNIAYTSTIYLSEHEAFDLAESITVKKNAVL